MLTTALLIAAAGTGVGVAGTAVSGTYDFHLQSNLLKTMASHQHNTATASTANPAYANGGWTPQQRQTAAVDVKAAAFGSGLILIANLVVVGWVIALRGGRLDVVPPARRRRTSAATVRDPATADRRVRTDRARPSRPGRVWRYVGAVETDLALPDGRTLHVYDTGSGTLPVFWHHGTPNIGTPPAPLFPVSDPLGIRWLSYDRPGYGGSSPRPDRDIASAAGDVLAIADALGIDRFAVAGHSGGGAHALACGALLPDRVRSVLCISGLAPFGVAGLDWFAGMAPAGEASLRAAVAGRAAKERHEATSTEDDPGFVPADLEALAGAWSWFLTVVGPAMAGGPAPLIDDDLAAVGPWGFDPADIAVPVLVLHGGLDRVVPVSHGAWLAGHCPEAQLRVDPAAGHISVLDSAPAALEWLAGS